MGRLASAAPTCRRGREAGPRTGARRRGRPVRGRRAATEHLLELGHGPSSTSRARDWREAQQRSPAGGTLRRRRGPPRRSRRLERTSGYELGRELPAARGHRGLRRQRPDGARAVARAARSGPRVPRDVSVVGFDDIPEAAYFTPPLTTVRQDFIESAAQPRSPARADRPRRPVHDPRDRAERARRREPARHRPAPGEMDPAPGAAEGAAVPARPSDAGLLRCDPRPRLRAASTPGSRRCGRRSTPRTSTSDGDAEGCWGTGFATARGCGSAW